MVKHLVKSQSPAQHFLTGSRPNSSYIYLDIATHSSIIPRIMIRRYIRKAWRSFLHQKGFSLINTVGLAIGMGCCMLILIYLQDEWSFNRFNQHLDQTYRINWISRDNSRVNVESSTPIPFSKSLETKIPGILKLAKLYSRNGEMEAKENPAGSGHSEKRFQEKQVYFTDPDLFDIFSIRFLSGDKNGALSAPNSVVITDEMAAKYFGSASPIGKFLLYDNKTLLKVTAVVGRLPLNSDLRFDFLISFETLYHVESPVFAEFIKNDWTFNPCDTWILLDPRQDPLVVQQLLNQHLQQEGTTRNHQMNSVALQPLRAIHLYASGVIGNASTSDIKYVLIFLAIALLILVIANVNFINLSVARSMSKIKEVGVRKVMGAGKRQLVREFLSGTVLTSFVSFLIACLLTVPAIPVLNDLTGRQFGQFAWMTLPNMGLFILLFFISGILAGLYPAFFIARFKMTDALLGKSGNHKKRNLIQKSLLVFQFTISVVLIIGAVIIYQQLQFLRDKPLGFQKHQVLVVPIFGSGAFSYGIQVDSSMRRRMNQFAAAARSYSRINEVTASSEMPGQGFIRGLVIPEGAREEDNVFAPWLSVDYNFIPTMHMQLIAGRDFSKNTGTDHLRAFIINESAVRAFGWQHPDSAIGKNLVRGKMADGKKGQIIGVIRDFDFNSLTNPMEPLVIDVNPPRFTEFAINIKPDHVTQTIGHLRQIWDSNFPERVFEYSFLDKDIDTQYKDKENFSRMIGYFAVSAILLSCSGLFSLSFFLVVKRSREISIRKVLGATVPSVIFLLAMDFMKMVLISVLIGIPVAWFLLHTWLESFAYQVPLSYWVFIFAALLVMIISFFTISLQSVRAATDNPVKNLRSE
jgi:putative ABC transport system permease protein